MEGAMEGAEEEASVGERSRAGLSDCEECDLDCDTCLATDGGGVNAGTQRCLDREGDEEEECEDEHEKEEEEDDEEEDEDGVERKSEEGARLGRTGGARAVVTYKDTATWTAEDGMPSPPDSSPLHSPHSGFLLAAELAEELQAVPLQPIDSSNTSSNSWKAVSKSRRGGAGSSGSHHQSSRHHHRHRRQQKISHPQQLSECFTVSSQLMSREARLYENVPTSPSGLQSLGLLLSEIHPQKKPPMSGGGPGFSQHSSNNSNETASTSGHNSAKKSSTAMIVSTNELLNITELLGVSVGPPSRASWADSGRESLSLDGDNNNSHGSSKNLLLYPPPPPQNASSSPRHSHSNCPSPLHCAPAERGGGGSKKSRRERLVRQKQAIEDTFHPLELSKYAGGPPGGGMVPSQFLGVPSPRRGVIPSGLIVSSLLTAGASPISLQPHPDTAQLLLHENKKCQALMACESPYVLSSPNEWTRGGKAARSKSPQRGLPGHAPPTCGSVGGQGGVGGNGGALSFAASKLVKPGGGAGGKYGQSFDYGELPSHQMFPKRHLLAHASRHFSHQLPCAASPHNPNSANNGSSLNVGGEGGQGHVPPPSTHLAPPQHRSFPAGLLSGVAPRSCSMGDLTSCNSSAGGGPRPSDAVPISAATTGGIPSTVPLVTSLPLPPATSVTYEFSLAPVSGTLAPGWHLTAVQRGLATAVPLAAVVARRRLPRPRPSARQRFGFTDKNEARRAKWTILITALALLAMSMLLVGVTLRLAPLIDDLVRKENEHLLKVIQHTSVNVTSSSTAATLLQTETNSIAKTTDGGEDSADNFLASEEAENARLGSAERKTLKDDEDAVVYSDALASSDDDQ